jgi:hypothetical protein
MVFTLIHEINKRQEQVADRAAAIREDQRTLDNWRSTRTAGGREHDEQWPVTEAELQDAKLSEKAVAVLQEIA